MSTEDEFSEWLEEKPQSGAAAPLSASRNISGHTYVIRKTIISGVLFESKNEWVCVYLCDSTIQT